MAYYLNHHIPMVRQLLGSALKGVSVEQGISAERDRLLRMSQPVISCLTQLKPIKRASARSAGSLARHPEVHELRASHSDREVKF